MSFVLDDVDHRILDLLQAEARMTNAALAAQVGLSAPAVFERIRKLEKRGVIRKYSIQVDPAAVGRPLTAFIRVTAAFDERYDSGLQAISQDPEVLECYHVAGEDCLILKTQCGGPSDLQGLLGRIRERITVQRSVTMIALSAVKEHGALRLAPREADAEKAKPVRGRRSR